MLLANRYAEVNLESNQPLVGSVSGGLGPIQSTRDNKRQLLKDQHTQKIGQAHYSSSSTSVPAVNGGLSTNVRNETSDNINQGSLSHRATSSERLVKLTQGRLTNVRGCSHTDLITIQVHHFNKNSKSSSENDTPTFSTPEETFSTQTCCRECGCFISKTTGIAALKEQIKCFEVDVAPIDIHQGLLREEAEIITKQEQEQSLTLDDLRDLEELRTQLVDKISAMADKMSLGRLTLHTAISYIDRLVGLSHQRNALAKNSPADPSSHSSKVITPRQRIGLKGNNQTQEISSQGRHHQLQMSSQSPRIRKILSTNQEMELKAHLCLLIAAKIEETDDIQGTSERIPHCMMLKELRKAARFQFPREDYLREEGPTFRALSWSLMCLTPLHFLHSLISMGLLYEDDKILLANSQPKLDLEKILEKVRYHSESYMEIWLRKTWCILYKNERRYRPSVVAISCVLAARRAVGVNPILSERMKEMALLEECYDDGVYDEIGECYELVCNIQGIRKATALVTFNSLNQTGSANNVKKSQYLTQTAPKVKSQVSTCDRSPIQNSGGSGGVASKNHFRDHVITPNSQSTSAPGSHTNNKEDDHENNILEQNQNLMNNSLSGGNKGGIPSLNLDNEQENNDNEAMDEQILMDSIHQKPNTFVQTARQYQTNPVPKSQSQIQATIKGAIQDFRDALNNKQTERKQDEEPINGSMDEISTGYVKQLGGAPVQKNRLPAMTDYASICNDAKKPSISIPTSRHNHSSSIDLGTKRTISYYNQPHQKYPVTKKLSISITSNHDLSKSSNQPLVHSVTAAQTLRRVLHQKHKSSHMLQQQNFVRGGVEQNIVATSRPSLSGAKFLKEKQSHIMAMIERSSSQLQLSQHHNDDSQGYVLTTKQCGELDESCKAHNLPIISESTEKLCTLKLKQFGEVRKIRNELPTVMKSCVVVESFDEDFVTTQNQVFKRVGEKPISLQGPYSATNKRTGGGVENEKSTFSLLNYFIKSKQSGVVAAPQPQPSISNSYTNSTVSSAKKQAKNPSQSNLGRNVVRTNNMGGGSTVNNNKNDPSQQQMMSFGSQSQREYGLISQANKQGVPNVVKSVNIPLSQHFPETTENTQNQASGNNKEYYQSSKQQQTDSEVLIGEGAQNNSSSASSKMVYDAYLITNTQQQPLLLSNEQTSRNSATAQNSSRTQHKTNYGMIDLTQRPNLVPKITVEAPTEESLLEPSSQQDVESVAERQGSARLFAAFKKNFNHNTKLPGNQFQSSRQLNPVMNPQAKLQTYQTAQVISGRQSQTKVMMHHNNYPFSSRKESINSGSTGDLFEYISANNYPLRQNHQMFTMRYQNPEDQDEQQQQQHVVCHSKLSNYGSSPCDPQHHHHQSTTNSQNTYISLRKPLPSLSNAPSKLHPVISGAQPSQIKSTKNSSNLQTNKVQTQIVSLPQSQQQSARAPLESKAAKGITSKMSDLNTKRLQNTQNCFPLRQSTEQISKIVNNLIANGKTNKPKY